MVSFRKILVYLSNVKCLLFLLMHFTLLSSALANEFVFAPINTSNGLSDNQIRYILQLPDGRMVFTTNGNVNLYDGVGFRYLHRSPEHIYQLNKYDGHYRIYQSNDSLLWIKDYQKLMCIDLRLEKYVTELDTYFYEKGITKEVGDFFLDAESGIWLLIDERLFQPESSVFFDLSLEEGSLQDLVSRNNQLYLFYDTGEVVCYHLETKERLYRSSAYPPEERNFYRNTSLVVVGEKGFYQLRNGSKGGCFFFDPENRSWETLLIEDYNLNTLIVTSEEKVYISCVKGIWVVDPEKQEKQYLPVLKTIEGNEIVTQIATLFYDKQGGLWVGTFNRGLLYYHPSRYKFTYVGRSSFPELSSEDIVVQAFAEDESGNIYIKCHSDYYRYFPQANGNSALKKIAVISLQEEIYKKLNEYKGNQEFKGNSYTAFCIDSWGRTWAGTADGLELFLPDIEEKRVLYAENGLSNNFIHGILEDRNQNIWVTTSYGISRIQTLSSGEDIYITNFNSYDGTLQGEYIQGAVYEAKDGTLYFGGVDGFNVLHPSSLSFPELPFKPLFTGLRLRGEEVVPQKFYDNRMILDKMTPYTKSLEFSYNQNFLTFEFSALNYINPAQTYYQFRLKGFDSEWRQTTVEGKGEVMSSDGILRISYTNLPPGKYILQVVASDNSYSWDREVTEIAILIHAPWWKTGMAYTLYVLFSLIVICGSVWGYIHLTKKRLERQHKEEILLLRIRNLIEQCNQYEEDKTTLLRGAASSSVSDEDNGDSLIQEKNFSLEEEAFLSKAMELVEKNLNVPGYSVEYLSRDLCMERTGLYRKLIGLLDESPSLFIRNIRLRRAAQLLLEDNLSITEISERTGFSSASYMSKCFQEMFGCKPSEYAERSKKTT